MLQLSLIFMIYLLLFLYPILINAEENYNVNNKLNDDELQIIIYTCYVVGSLNAIGCFFVFCKTFVKWILCKKDKNRLTMSYRLPFYTAISGMIWMTDDVSLCDLNNDFFLSFI
jgi:hypothetical protein